MNINRKRALYFAFLLYFILACRTYAFNTPQSVFPKDSELSDSFTCRGYYDTVTGTGYNCVMKCPSVEEYAFDVPDLTVFMNRTDADIKAQYCPVDDSTSLNPPPTEPPTDEPAPTDPPAETTPLKPYLTGAFTACDNVAGYVNFTIAPEAPPYDPATFKLLFNDQVAKCAPASNNPKVLTCNYPPAPYGPPAYIQVMIGEEIVNDFKFDGGSICTTNVPNPNPAPEPTEDPNNSAPPADGND